ncbi:MAG: hypothetical protein IKR40_05985 [Treponema sp.]|nr:hypothetical protein [Treponema sp.]
MGRAESFRTSLSSAARVFFGLLFFAGVLTLFFSCSSPDTRILNISSTVVFEFKDEENPPSCRLSVFTETSGDERRVSQIRAVHDASSLVWTCNLPRKFAGQKNVVWAGYTNFVPATGSLLPQGSYRLVYVDASGEETEGSFRVAYPEKLATSHFADYPQILSGVEEIYAIYDIDGNLMYFDGKKENWKSSSDIKNDYGLADKFRVCYRINKGTVICMMPEEKLP